MRQSAKLGMALLLISEAVFFFMLLLAFVIFRAQSVRIAAETLNLPLTSVYTVCLLASSFTLWHAARTAEGQEGGRTRLWMGFTILLGLAFLVGQSGEYLRILHRGATVRQGLFATTFFTLTGLQAVHVLAGILLLVGTLRGVFTIQTVATFWHFVDGLWIVLFSVLYLWTFL